MGECVLMTTDTAERIPPIAQFKLTREVFTFEELIWNVGEKFCVLSNADVDMLFFSGTELGKLNVGEFWTGTILVFANRGRQLGDGLTDKGLDGWHYADFSVPESMQKFKDTALVLNHPDFSIHTRRSRNTRVIEIPEEKIKVVHDFPGKSGLYQYEKESGVPFGSSQIRAKSLDGLRRLLRDDYGIWSIVPIRRNSERPYDIIAVTPKRHKQGGLKLPALVVPRGYD